MQLKAGIEDKGLRVNMGKTKVTRCRVETGKVVKSVKYPCGSVVKELMVQTLSDVHNVRHGFIRYVARLKAV